MKVHMHTKFCFLCVVTFLFHQCNHCHGDGHHHHHHAEENHVHDHNDFQISQAPYMQGRGAGNPPSEHSPDEGHEAETEQRFYIQQLFRRYGKQDRLDFGSFQSLLFSLGLGEIRVVELDHEDLGHDHVAHLDALEVQQGLHSHSHSHSHTHPHTNTHPHPHPHIHAEDEKNTTTVRDLHNTQCNQSNQRASEASLSSTLKPPMDRHSLEGQDYSHNESEPHRHLGHSHHHHSHQLHRHHQHNSSSSHPIEPHNTTADQQQQTQSIDSKAKKPRKNKKGVRNKDTAVTSLPPSPPPHSEVGEHGNESREPFSHTEEQRDHFHTHRDSNESGHNLEQSHSSGDEHTSVRKREAPDGHRDKKHSVSDSHQGDSEQQFEECLNVTQLLHYYGLSPEMPISPAQFTYLCPALLYQIDSRVCIHHYHQLDIEPQKAESTLSAWLWGLLSITVISLLSLLGVILVPIINQSCFKFLLTFLVALAVGTLSGDALLHLLPHSQGGHDHSHDESQEETDLLVEYDGVWKGLTALGGIYLLFIIEHCIGMFKHNRDQGGSWCRKKRNGDESKIGRKLSDHKLNRRSDAEWLHLKPLTAEGLDSSALSCDSKHNDTQLTELPDPESPSKKPLAAADHDHDHQGANSPDKDSGRKVKTKKHSHGHSHGHGHSHHGHCHSDQEMKDAGIASIAWMVIMGDGMHNFSDGLAIGAAFSATVTGGISTSIAVFCHELPHELGDFAVLLKAGMSVKQAIVYNVLSALMAYVGMLIGTAVGQYTNNLTSWIFAVTAGMFLYVALVDMLPEMLHGDSEEHKRCQLGHFLLQNVGMLVGFGIMLLIAIFEDKIVLDINF
uniref:Solute carrier family 39 member 10 n=1 Tax=Lepisosteus oculatus TaxID=7918 RepID=W5MCL2_LEPOC|nr:PREDICTED: zinc transporter ZIP10 [Lepisosteus oculatus]XP_015214226.1 PREDICTED: zinc transporter ZIP10 [Lepisosteus oculatus]XP_015214227.1 PREDICTED: zinc transporter ZIP10 [Lepisosteus oculatus]XP_015214228.1 PREDICTED: zinc transporter ZIP10 [Lepisosteus oculatus]